MCGHEKGPLIVIPGRMGESPPCTNLFWNSRLNETLYSYFIVLAKKKKMGVFQGEKNTLEGFSGIQRVRPNKLAYHRKVHSGEVMLVFSQTIPEY